MASSSGNTSESSLLQNSGSENDLNRNLIDERKRKRKQSNKESARRSRMRKQKLLDDLTAEISRLTKENGQIVACIAAATQRSTAVEAENSVLTARIMELGHRLQSLDQIISNFMSCNINEGIDREIFYGDDENLFTNGLELGFLQQQQPITADAEIFQI